MRNIFKKFVESGEKNNDIIEGEIIEKSELPQYVADEVEKINIEYSSASNNGLFRALEYRKVDLGDGKINYLINGTLSIHAPSSISGNNYIGIKHVQFIIEVQDNEVSKVEKKYEDELLAA